MPAAFGFGSVGVATIPAGQGSGSSGRLRLRICREFEVAMAAACRVSGRRCVAAVRAVHFYIVEWALRKGLEGVEMGQEKS